MVWNFKASDTTENCTKVIAEGNFLVNFKYSTRVKIGIILIILFALSSDVNARLLKQILTFNPKLIDSDEVTLYEKRFKELKKMLPPHGVMGYITDKAIVNPEHMEPQLAKDYFLTQYALSPIIVIPQPNLKLLVGNFRNSDNISKFSTNKNLVLLRNFGSGVALFKNEDK